MSDTSTVRVEYIRQDNKVIDVGDLTSKILNTKILEEENINDLDIALATQAMERVLQEGISETIDGLILIDPKASSVLAALVYTGIKLKAAEARNDLTLREVNEETE